MNTRATMTRRRLLTASVVGALAMSGCRQDQQDRQSTPPVRPFVDDEVVFTAQSWFGLAPPLYAALNCPQLVVFASGMMVWIGPDRTSMSAPAHYLRAEVGAKAVAQFAVAAAATGLLGPDVDYGFPQITDVSSDTLTLHRTGSAIHATVYGFDIDDDRLNLTRGQRARRRDLRALLDRAQALSVAAEVVDYVSTRVAVVEQDAQYAPAPTRRWPGPDPTTFLHDADTDAGNVRSAIACGAIVGPAAHEVYLAARANPGQSWLVGGRRRLLVVNPSPIGVDC